MNDRNDAIITFFGEQVRVACDRNCQKAWGINGRPSIQLDDDDWDDYVYLSDGELPEAPTDPGTYEGGEGKPLSPDWFPTKWCVRECERSSMRDFVNDDDPPVPLRDYSSRVYNLPDLHTEDA